MTTLREALDIVAAYATGLEADVVPQWCRDRRAALDEDEQQPATAASWINVARSIPINGDPSQACALIAIATAITELTEQLRNQPNQVTVEPPAKKDWVR